MDVSTLTTRNSMAASATTVTATNKPAFNGNSLPDVGQVRVRLEKPQVDKPADGTTTSEPNTEELRVLVGQANEVLQARFSDLKFTVDEGTDINIVRIEDSETGELIRQFPSEAMVAIARALDNVKQGMVFEETA